MSSLPAKVDALTSTNSCNAEQPQTKRQKIDKKSALKCVASTCKNVAANNKSCKAEPIEVVATETVDSVNCAANQHLCSSLSSSSNSIHSSPNSSNNSRNSTPSTSRPTSFTKFLNAQHIANMLPKTTSTNGIHGLCIEGNATQVSTVDEVDRIALPIASNALVDYSSEQDVITISEMRNFEESLTQQCLCGVTEETLRKPFQSHYFMDASGQKRVANLNEWPTSKLLQFLSNLQLLFNIYLKQNSKGFICARIMDVCDALIRNDYNLIEEIIVLAGFSNCYVQFLSSRVLACFLVIAKEELADNWLKKLVDNLFNFEHLNYNAVTKIQFSLEIIKRIVEWKDVDLHPLDAEALDPVESSSSNAGTSSPTHTQVNLHFPMQQPTLDSNYFAVHYGGDVEAAPSSSTAGIRVTNNDESVSLQNGCHVITLTDSESFDTTHLKCITIKILENKWPALVKNMSTLIANHREVHNAENCILNFLQLWENIISVKANLSIVETLPFYAQLEKLELLLSQNLSCIIYKQMLCLFNEALCYGSTLALQDMLPDETCQLAHQIVRHVKDDFRILDTLPRRRVENTVSLLGFKGKSIVYDQHTSTSSARVSGEDGVIDKTILQKLVLLVLKSIAVTVKEIRSDSSDSSIDSTDNDAFQDMVLIERSIRDVLRKLEVFVKQRMQFHPESHFSKILIRLFEDQDDHLIEAMVCTLDVTAGISFRNNAFPELVAMLNPVFTFLEFLKMISNSSSLLLDLLVSNETCFLLYLLRFLKYIRQNWTMFVQSCRDFGMGESTLDESMMVLTRLRLKISRLVSIQLYPYDISPVLRLLESCECLYEGNDLN